MGEPDFKAFEDFVRAGNDAPVVIVPRNAPGPTTHYMHVNLGAYATASPDQQNDAHAKIMAHLEQSAPSEDTKNIYKDLLEEAKSYAGLSTSGGGVMMAEERGMFLTDHRSISQTADIEDTLQKYVTQDTSTIDRYAQEKVRRHEAAHTTLGLEEPGSDFVAAATMLRDMPESRKMWENEADLRLVYGLQRGIPTLESYGVECHDAIKRALAMTPEELKGASTQTLYAIGMEYDTQNALNRSLGAKSAEGQILQAISNETGQGMFDSLLKKQWENVAGGKPRVNEDALEGIRLNKSTPDAMIAAVKKMNTGDPEIRRIGEALKESVGRLDRYTEPNTPAAAPKMEPQTAPALTN